MLHTPSDGTFDEGVRGSERTTVDWTGLPLRVVRRLGRARALELLDRRDLQEEYVEWRVVRARGETGIARVELTTELPEPWVAAAARDPAGRLGVQPALVPDVGGLPRRGGTIVTAPHPTASPNRPPRAEGRRA